ncbi:MAG: endolytic transglycosylase MltG [Bacteroidaceae bacterium]|nr:endolytic transglycosylase MltG [Bacteroidaceae bacterium]
MKRKILWLVIGLAIILIGIAVFTTLSLINSKAPNEENGKGRLIYIDRDDTADSVRTKSALGWRWGVYSRVFSYHTRTGRYHVLPGMTCLQLYRLLRNGTQEPMNFVVPTSRTMDKLAVTLSQSLMVDSAEIATALTDSTYLATRGYTTATIPALFIPNTYEVYWDISVDKLIERMERENNRFWTAERKAKADACGLTHEQVATLASIVDEETANDAEKPMIAGLYLNRLRIGMPLQADPTVKFAVGDFSLRRILGKHLKTVSPYNTYLIEGLPPGPIRIASIAGLDAVLNHAEHNYLYMCAKEDFSGTHNFATTLSEHYRNARAYIKALNARGIK